MLIMYAATRIFFCCDEGSVYRILVEGGTNHEQNNETPDPAVLPYDMHDVHERQRRFG